ncbi:MAG: hypothetical protein HOL44_05855 [Campylobacteraceae bacterium]|jgi:hypothetical protein|nr:hypothetical protein [Campylobacteraceae bacterium]MBT5539840.1 hypothetical protein [Candidatus Neomarinimicrobiota bacterium]
MDTLYLEQYRAGIEAGKNAIKMSFFINGGAILSILTFIGSIFNKERVLAIELFGSLIWFSSAILLVGISSGLVYITHICLGKDKLTYAKYSEITTIVFICISYICFIIGGYNIYAIILELTAGTSL